VGTATEQDNRREAGQQENFLEAVFRRTKWAAPVAALLTLAGCNKSNESITTNIRKDPTFDLANTYRNDFFDHELPVIPRSAKFEAISYRSGLALNTLNEIYLSSYKDVYQPTEQTRWSYSGTLNITADAIEESGPEATKNISVAERKELLEGLRTLGAALAHKELQFAASGVFAPAEAHDNHDLVVKLDKLIARVVSNVSATVVHDGVVWS